MSYSIAFIAPYKKLGELFSEVCAEFNKDVVVRIGDLEAGAQIAVELEEEGFDAVISRGGTAMAIKNSVTDLPVVDIQVSGFDLIRILDKARQETDMIALAGFEPFTHGIEGLGDIMGITLKVLTLKEEWYEQPDFIEERLKEVKGQGYNFVVGDNISVKMARKLKMKTLLIRSGKEALIRAVFEAERVARTRRNEMKKTRRIKSIIDSAYEGIISINQEGKIDTFNNSAEKIFNLEAYKVIGEDITDLLPELGLMEAARDKQQENGKICTIGEQKVAANIIPIEVGDEVVGVVATCQKVSRIQQMEQKIREEIYLKGHVADNTFDDIIGESNALQQAIEEAKDYAGIDSPLLIYGETGTGKELFAQAIHNAGPRKNKPFVAFNCAALPENLLESELFGYVKGAFTGAQTKGKPGFFEQAHEGTIFLDEIGEISYNIQVRLLRVIQERKVRRLGDDRIRPVDVRIIVATNKDLYQLVKESKFREDLFYRINVLNLNLPPLRERKEDIALLTEYFIKKYRYKLNKSVEGIADEGINILKEYEWPGNIRQLENIIERLIIRARSSYIMTGLVRESIASLQGKKEIEIDKVIDSNKRYEFPLTLTLEEIEKQIIRKVIEEEKGNRKAAADRLGISRTTIWRKLNEE